MAHFEIRIDSGLPAPLAWRRILDLRAHTAVIPFTTVTGDTLDAAALTPGSRFTARTSVGRLGVDDVMVVDGITAPTGTSAGCARIHKEGGSIGGSIELTVTPHEGGSRVVWRQDIDVRHVPGLADPVVARVARAVYASTLRKLLARG